MSSCSSVALDSFDSRVTLVPGASGKPSGKIQDLDAENLSGILGFLTPTELASAERVSRSWRATIKSEDQWIWKQYCETQKVVPVMNPVTTQNIHQVIGDYILHEGLSALIAEYAFTDYKELATIVRGNVAFYYGTWYINEQSKNGLTPELRWETDAREPFVCVSVASKESRDRCEAEHGRRCRRTSWQGTWHDVAPRALLAKRFPNNLPLRLFVNPDGSYKKRGDQVKLLYNGKRVILTCRYSGETTGGGERITTFEEALAYRVQVSIACQFTSERNVEQAKATGRISGEWISSE